MIDDSRFFEHFLETPVSQDPRCPVVLVFDIPKKYSSAPLDALNAGLRTFISSLSKDPKAALRVDLAVILLGESAQRCEFTPAQSFQPPVLKATDVADACAGITLAIEMTLERKRDYEACKTGYYRPWVFFISGRSGAPDVLHNPGWTYVTDRVKLLDSRKEIAFFPVGLPQSDRQALAQLSNRQPLRIRDGKIDGMFAWLAANLTRVANSVVGQEVKLDSPMSWGEM